MDSETRLADGRYVVRGVLGEGAQGVTYDAYDTRDDRPVAIKRFDVRGARSWKDVELAEREVRVLATLDHPLMPRYLTHFEEDGALYLVMEKVEGETLDAMRKRYAGPLPEDEVRRFLSCADRALTYLHGRGFPVVHRDIKPRNVIRRADGSYVFVDFGAVSELVMRRGSASTVVGTIGYMAPEQFQGRALPASDVYAVGATALAALTGAEPETLHHIGLRVDVRGALEGKCSAALIASLERMLEPDPDQRASSLAQAFDGIQAASVAPPPPPPRVVQAALVANTSEEDALVKSIRKLLWVLWGLGWVLVPVIVSRFHHPSLIPLIMFSSLAAVIIATWHKGFLVRAALRALAGRQRAGETEARVDAEPRRRIAPGHTRQVRVHTAELDPVEVAGETQRDTGSDGRAKAVQARSRTLP